MSDLAIPSLRGGLNVDEPPHLLDDDQCSVAMNVEFWFSSLGERRLGCQAFDITGSGLADEAAVAFLTQWFPTNDIAHPEIWALGVTPDVSVTLSKRTALGTWSEITPADPIDVDSPDVYGMTTQVLNAKQFFAYKSDVDRLHVWDGDTLRRVGLDEPPAPPTAVDEGSGLTYLDTRYFRIRYIKQNVDGDILLRSEPSESVTFEPSETGAGARITRPALIGESETHWFLWASPDNVNYYLIGSTAVGTSTFDDNTAPASYATIFASQ